jgi:hypothetical protein
VCVYIYIYIYIYIFSQLTQQLQIRAICKMQLHVSALGDEISSYFIVQGVNVGYQRFTYTYMYLSSEMHV